MFVFLQAEITTEERPTKQLNLITDFFKLPTGTSASKLVKEKAPNELLETVNKKVTADKNSRMPDMSGKAKSKVCKSKSSESCDGTPDLDSSLIDFDTSDSHPKKKTNKIKKKERVQNINGEHNTEHKQSVPTFIEVSYEDFLKNECVENGVNDSEIERTEEHTDGIEKLKNEQENDIDCNQREDPVLSTNTKNANKLVEEISDNPRILKRSTAENDKTCGLGNTDTHIPKSGKPSSRKSSDISSFFTKTDKTPTHSKEEKSIICVMEEGIRAEPTPAKKPCDKVFSIFSKKSARTGLEAGVVEMLPAFEGKKSNVAVAEDMAHVEIPDSTPNEQLCILNKSSEKRTASGVKTVESLMGKHAISKSDVAPSDTSKEEEPDIIVEGESKCDTVSICAKKLMAEKMASLDQIKVKPVAKTSQATLSFGKGGLTAVKPVNKTPVPEDKDSKKEIDITGPEKSGKKKRKSKKIVIENDGEETNNETIDITTPELACEKRGKKKKMVIQSDDEETIKTPRSRSKKRVMKEDKGDCSEVKCGKPGTKRDEKKDPKNGKK